MAKQSRSNETLPFILIILGALLVIFMFGHKAHAGGDEPGQHQGQQQSQGQEQSQDQSQFQTATQANEQSIRQEKQANTVVPPSVFASGPCFGAFSAGIGIPAVNVGGGKTKLDKQCELRETARLLNALGERELAVRLLCTSDAAQVLGDDCKSSTDLKKKIANLQRDNAVLMREREYDRKECEQTKNRIAEAKACDDK